MVDDELEDDDELLLELLEDEELELLEEDVEIEELLELLDDEEEELELVEIELLDELLELEELELEDVDIDDEEDDVLIEDELELLDELEEELDVLILELEELVEIELEEDEVETEDVDELELLEEEEEVVVCVPATILAPITHHSTELPNVQLNTVPKPVFILLLPYMTSLAPSYVIVARLVCPPASVTVPGSELCLICKDAIPQLPALEVMLIEGAVLVVFPAVVKFVTVPSHPVNDMAKALVSLPGDAVVITISAAVVPGLASAHNEY